MIHLVPVKGKRVRHPDTKKVIGDEGVHVESITTYWHRRLQDGSMVEQKQAAPTAAPKATASDSKDKK